MVSAAVHFSERICAERSLICLSEDNVFFIYAVSITAGDNENIMK